MSSTSERQNDILKIISHLDITPTMFKNAVEKYQAIARFLAECGINADIYPQGSFALGTVIRPAVKDPNASYDLDFICQVDYSKENISPSELRRRIETALTSSDRYGGKITECDECFTIEYADINGVPFTIDIVPAVAEDRELIESLISLSTRPELLDTAIAIPRHNGTRNYDWLTNNPRGLKSWFDEINKPFLETRRAERRKTIFEENRSVFNSVEEIPDEIERSSLQRVIQILKYHRDVYYSHLKDGEMIKPISAIISILATRIASEYDPDCTVFDLLSFVVGELQIYSKHQNMKSSVFANTYGARSALTHDDGKWVIQNPANPKDNLADKWNSNPDIPKVFFSWIRACHTDLIESMKLPDAQFRVQIENAFGETTVERSLGAKYRERVAKSIQVTGASKPYKIV